MKFKLDRIISVATLMASVVAIILVLRKPAPVAPTQAPAAVAAHAQSFDQKVSQFQQEAQQSGGNGGPDATLAPSGPVAASSSTLSSADGATAAKAELHLNSDEIGAALTQALGAAAGGSVSPDTNVGPGTPTIKDQHVSMEGDVAHGQFLTQIAGKDVWITVSGHLGQKDGYATFDPTEFKVGDLDIPVSLVKPALEKKMQEERDRLKLPDYVGDVKVKDSELVMTQK
ncbi:MAG: hypothetical protein ABR921_03520 [Candidatus Sulfotelmatobacter sp.]|jgi:polyisoprenoid-binding protein YceI